MDNFAFVIHPVDPKKDVSRKFPLLGKYLPVSAINFFSRYYPPVYVSHITGVGSQANGKKIEGWFVGCPLTPQRSLELRLVRGLPAHAATLAGTGAVGGLQKSDTDWTPGRKTGSSFAWAGWLHLGGGR
jgi:hypothetical protein